MLSIYTSYSCCSCKKQLVLITEELESMGKDKYLACPYCGSRHIKKQKATDNLKECMNHSHYERNNGAITQRCLNKI